MVLEHLHQPLDVLQKLRSWVRPDGWLVLSVPDAGGLEFRLFGDRWYALQLPTHLHHFSPETLTRMLTAAGWAVDRTLWHGSATNTLMSLSYLARSEEHTSELQSLMRISYAVFCLKKKKTQKQQKS